MAKIGVNTHFLFLSLESNNLFFFLSNHKLKKLQKETLCTKIELQEYEGTK